MQIIGLIFGTFAVLATSVAFAFITAMVLQAGRAAVPMGVMLWVVFLIWQLAPVLVEAHSPGLSFREIARYPASFSVYFLFNAAYGLLDPAAITGLCWLFAMWIGVLWAAPDWALVAAGAFFLFASFNLLCNRLLMGLLERYQNTRKGRERVVIVSLIVVLLPQVVQLTWSSSIGLRPPAWLLAFVNVV
ncbi:MAG TPA: hypothetical protein VEW69_10925, partial [Alphaproteobacteria bacterium]|nr:hypothetical protein [Alphaproteobacteria bacterium]